MRNRMVGGGSFSQATVLAVWRKAASVPGHNPDQVRKDTCGARIHYSEYGKDTANGWEVDHIRPVSKGGSDDLSNLQPLHHENNAHKADNYPDWKCKRTQ